MKFKNGELKVKRCCSKCQRCYEVDIGIGECPKCGETLLMKFEDEQLENNQKK